MGDDKFLLTLEVDGRKYPLKINRSEEEAYRKAAKEVEYKFNQYRVAFGSNPNLISQDFMAMTAIQALVENFYFKNKNNTKPFEDTISLLIDELDRFLKK